MGEAKRRKKLDPNYGKPANSIPANDVWEEEDYECYGERADYFKNLDFHLNQGGAFEKGLPKYHQYKSVRESPLYQFIQNAINQEEQSANYILSKVKSLSDLTEISPDLLNLVDKSIMSKRNGDLNQAFKYYDQVFVHNQTWFMLWYGLGKLLCLFREYRMAFACIKICTFLYPRMWNGRQYRSDKNLSYHFDQIYSLAIAGEENEPYLKSLGRPLDTLRIKNANGKIKSDSPVSRVKVLKPEQLPVNDSEKVPSLSQEISKTDRDDKALWIKHHGAMTKRLTKPVYIDGARVESVHISVCKHPAYFNRGFCHIKTESHQITLWLDAPFKKKDLGIENSREFPVREWYGIFTTEIIDGKTYSVNRKFSMKSLPHLSAEFQRQAMFTGKAVDRFVIEGLISTKTSVGLLPEEIMIQAPLSYQHENVTAENLLQVLLEL